MRSPISLFAALILAAGPASAATRDMQTTHRSTEIAIGEGAAALRGTLLTPANDKGAQPVLILAGSGPTDRNGNSPAGISAQSYWLLAERLAAEGIASLRVDKRGIAASAAAATSEQELRIETFADDARGWARTLRASTGARCVWLLGHSEGAMHALLAAQKNEDICGVILVSAMGRPMADLLREQLRANSANAPILDEALGIIDKLESGQSVEAEGMHPALLPLFRASVQPFVISMMAVDPAALVSRYEGPVLVVQGTTDLQTNVKDARRLAEARAGVEVEIIEGMNHVLKPAPPDRAANVATYMNPDLPLAPGLVDAIVRFMRR